jgi:hypothetical protein
VDRVGVADPAEEQTVVDELNTARDSEYAEVLERLPAVRQELSDERARGGQLTYAEVEESEADLDRFRVWLAKIAARDYFRDPGSQAARAAAPGARPSGLTRGGRFWVCPEVWFSTLMRYARLALDEVEGAAIYWHAVRGPKSLLAGADRLGR